MPYELPHAGQTLLLGRHARTALNAAGRIRGRSDPALDETGLAEAAAMAERLSGSGVEAVVTSPLQRARVTAETVAARLAIPVRVDERFTDRDFGEWTGHLISEVETRWGSLGAAPGVEPEADVLDRTLPALDDALRWSAPILVVTHDVVIEPLTERLTEGGGRLTVPTGGWVELRRADRGPWRHIAR
ncbi:hypothetical protein GCM10009840_30600 [Pseudolysinimonas kribbensis]|uniref:Histidine phosphatase family protein n=1 Tax=Pseudolysinimonas kribbensis TaxID=433641 RepID=A0ABQ6K8M6_9MICO|nr:histidine phosphatase family protein [Pseudolysinimonas kribbensis]GMA96091.1 hypothetical protein GCM10025881_29150 [Pseudolysinimonas kribbensis]